MKTNELRIGNFVLYQEYYIATVHGITDPDYGNGIHVHYDNVCIGCEHDLISGIPLTEEWLRKFGFIVKSKNYSLNVGGELFEYAVMDNICIWHDKNKGWTLDQTINFKTHFIQYVHQLQNLYFALTCNELTIKEEQQ